MWSADYDMFTELENLYIYIYSTVEGCRGHVF